MEVHLLSFMMWCLGKALQIVVGCIRVGEADGLWRLDATGEVEAHTVHPATLLGTN